MSRRKEEGKKEREKKIFFNDFHFLPLAWKKSPRPISKEIKDGKLWLNIIQHDSSSLTFFSSSEAPRFVWTGICFERFISLRSNQIKSNQLEWNERLPAEKISADFFGVTFSAVKKGLRAKNIEEDVHSRRSDSLEGFKVHKMLSTQSIHTEL